MITKKIVITGGPSTGKTTIINHLETKGKTCYHEISRAITLEAQKQNIEQLFLEDPTLFSQKLLEGRIDQFLDAAQKETSCIFMDRGIPDVIAYMNYINQSNPKKFIEACDLYKYDMIFLLPPWKEIHITDNERYENFDQAIEIHEHLLETYNSLSYDCIEVPTGTVEERCDFILNKSM
ncbi:AAA family ATPase [Aquimarina hainanensis]|uniref:AAA family ATPase n=1 Tax=Aquimarina hainanensis TaxID=1578017 RepID=A0ABW5NAL6_9FLAO|nr:ATP-binding protein [Aquimarina sp. TRL1]QKX06909.1 ATP-binding protein [Aquimarina sp. TRL1]